jgi:hypothetical protein
MAAKIICDGCGKEEPMVYANHNWMKPHLWYQRSDKDGMQDACSRECIKKIAEKSGKTSVVAPF